MTEAGDAPGLKLTQREKRDAESRKHPRAQVLYEAIRIEGEHELGRPAAALAWSGLAAGLSMGFSLVAMGLSSTALPEAPWAMLIVSLGYSVGFLIVIIARQQLFTENTLTPVIPLLHNQDRSTFGRVLRLWAIVLSTNLVGTCAFAFVIQRADVFSPEVHQAFERLAQHALLGGFASHFLRALFSGWLIALMTWMLAGTDARVFVIVLITLLIGAGDLSHIVAGSSEAFYALFSGAASLDEVVANFLVPVGLGNVLGGTALVALLNYAQVSSDEAPAE
jgi:formate/nitrite transporter FocA (FNT family)